MITITGKLYRLQIIFSFENREEICTRVGFLGPVTNLLAWDLKSHVFTLLHIDIASQSQVIVIHNYKVLVIEIQIKATAGGETTITITVPEKQ